MTVPSWSDVQTRLATSEPDTFRLSRGTASIPEVGDALASLGLEALLIEQAKVTSATAELMIAGTTSLFFIDGMTVAATFTGGEALSVSLVLGFPDDVRIDVPFIKVGIGRLSVTVTVHGPSLDVPVASIVLGGELTFDGHPVPITLTPGAHGWTLRAERIALPTLADVASLVGYTKDEVKAAMPPGVADLGGLSIAEFMCVLDTDRWTVSSISATVQTETEGEWRFPPAPFVALKKPVTLAIAVEFPEASGDDGDERARQDPKPILTGSLTGALKIGETLTVPISIARDGDAWRVGVLSASGFPTVGRLIGLMGDATIEASLPAAIGSLGLESSSFEVTIPDTGGVAVSFDARLKDGWTLVEQMVVVDDARLQLHVGGDGDVAAFFGGTVRFDDAPGPSAGERSADATWTLRLACSRRALPGVSALTPVPGGVPLPSALPAIELSEFTVILGDVGEPPKMGVRSMVLRAALTEPWSPPGLEDLGVHGDFGVHDAAVEVTVDEAHRVTATLLTTLDVATVPVPIAVKWEPA